MVAEPNTGEPGMLAVRNIEAMLRGFARFGLDPDALAREHASRAARHPPGLVGSMLAFNELYVAHMPPLSALFVGAETTFGQWEVIDLLGACYPTVGLALRHLARHFVLINPDVEFIVGDGEGDELPFVEFRHHAMERHEFFDEYTTGIFLAHFRALSATDLRLTAARSVRARPTDRDWCARIERFLGCAPTYGAAHARMVFTRAAWATPLAGANPRLRATLEAHALELRRELDQARSFGERVRLVIAQSLREGEPRIADVAQRLGITTRTLQRRLQDEALGFTALVEEARLHLARRYLAEDALSISEVSFALGYSEPSAFTRAFKRWSGSAPAEYRESVRRPP